MSRRERWLFAALLLLTAVPMFLVTYPPLADVAQHAAQIEMLMRFDDPICAYSSELELNWRSPYLFGYLIAFGLAHLVSVTHAIKATLVLAIVGVPLAFAVFVRALRAPAAWAFLGFPLAYTFALHWGFLNFCVTIPFAFLFLAAVVRYGERPTPLRGVGMGAALLFVFAAHALMAAFCGGIALLIMLRQRRDVLDAARWSLPFLATIPVALMWAQKTYAGRPDARTVTWGTEVNRVPEVLSRLLGEPASLLTVFLGAAIVAYPFLAGGRPSRRALDWLPLYAAVIWFFVAPQLFYGTVGVYSRFHVFMPALLLLAVVRPSGRARSYRFVPVVIALVWLGALAARWVRFEAESADFRALLDHLEPGHRAYALVPERWSDVEAGWVYLHFPSWYQARGGCHTEPSFARSFPCIVRYRDGAEPGLPSDIELNPQIYDLERFLRPRWSYVIVRSTDDPRDGLLRDIPLEELAREGTWWAFEWQEKDS